MTVPLAAQIVAANIAALAPLIVVRVAWHVGARHAASVGLPLARPRSMTAVGTAGAAASLIATIAVIGIGGPSPWTLAVAGLAFAVPAALALRALGDIDAATRSARDIGAVVRKASLARRVPTHFVPASWRATHLIASGLALGGFAYRLASAIEYRSSLVPVVFAFGTVVFLAMYEMWLSDVVRGPLVHDERYDAVAHVRIARRIFVAEVAVVWSCLTGAHILLNLDWARHGDVGASVSMATGVIGVLGCALLVASGLHRRAYSRVR